MEEQMNLKAIMAATDVTFDELHQLYRKYMEKTEVYRAEGDMILADFLRGKAQGIEEAISLVARMRHTISKEV